MPVSLRSPVNSVGLKFLLVCLLAGLMMIPILLVYGVLMDRAQRLNEVRETLSRAEGGRQWVDGPFLLIPYERTVVLDDGKTRMVTGEAVAFAQRGAAEATLAVVERRQDIYTIPTFRSETTFTATFEPQRIAAELGALAPDAGFDFARARMAVAVSNTVGVQEIALLGAAAPGAPEFTPSSILNGAAHPNPDRAAPMAPAGSIVTIPAGALLAGEGPVEVRVRLALAGAQSFALSAFAQNTTARVTGDWPDPNFAQGGFLPSARSVTAEGFTAEWSAPLARRGIPGAVLHLGEADLTQKTFMVEFVEPTTIYTGVDRALKYSILFIGLVFLAYFMFEVATRRRAHPAQYLMVGLAQAIFYLLLLAFAERLGFQTAFLIAASATVAQISLYVWAVFGRPLYVLPALAVFTGVYGLVYVLLEAEQDALLYGALAAFAALAVLMWMTRNVSWYGQGEAPPSQPGAAQS